MENNKTRTILTIAVLGVFLAAFTLWTVFKPADAASDAERRSLAQLPALTSFPAPLPTALRTTPPISSRCGMNSARSKHLPPQGCCASGIITACTGWGITWPNWNTP